MQCRDRFENRVQSFVVEMDRVYVVQWCVCAGEI